MFLKYGERYCNIPNTSKIGIITSTKLLDFQNVMPRSQIKICRFLKSLLLYASSGNMNGSSRLL
jgi:hypothetical protein